MFLICEYITVIFASLQKFVLTLNEFQGCLFSCFPEYFSILFWELWIIALLSRVPKLLSSLKQPRNLIRILSPPSSELPWIRPWTDFVEDHGSVLPLWCGPAPWEHSPALPTPTPTHCASLLSQTMPQETGSKVLVKRSEAYRLSLTHKVCSQVSRGNQTGLRKSGLDKPLSPVTFQKLSELFWKKMKFSLLLYNFQDPSFPPSSFFL